MFSDRDFERVADLLREAAAVELLPRFRNLGAGDIREKGPGDLVTVADEECERRLAAGLSLILPGAPVVGEEAVAAEPGLVAHIPEAEWAWIVDPLDGTANYARGDDRFAMIVALTHRGETVAGWIHDPIRGGMASASRGAGAHLDRARATLPAESPLSETSGFVGTRMIKALLAGTSPERRAQVGKLTTSGCAGLEYMAMLAGGSGFCLYRFTKPWDHAAGALMVREASGIANRHDGQFYRPSDAFNAGILCASSDARWREIHGLLLDAGDPGRPEPGIA